VVAVRASPGDGKEQVDLGWAEDCNGLQLAHRTMELTARACE
jgi:hypothetical protein